MSTIRRLYFYVLSLISIEVVIWGVVNLLRTVISGELIGSGSMLATGLSLVLVGLPIFLLHWQVAQRDARRDVEERSSRIRAVFLYAALITVLVPVTFSIMALIDRGVVTLLGQQAHLAWLGGNQSPADNLIAIIINGVVFLYFWRVLKADWQSDIPEDNLKDTRRLYRYLWMLYGLVLVVSGVYNLLSYLLSLPSQSVENLVPRLAGALAFLLVGAPIWAYTWNLIQTTLIDPAEQRSLLRLVVLYAISLAGVIGVLSTAGSVLTLLIRWILGESMTVVAFLQENSGQIGALVPLAVMWWYYAGILNKEVAAMPDQPRREALRRLYYYILSLLGLAVTFAGLLNLVDFLAQLVFPRQPAAQAFRPQLSGALSALLVGVPLWLLSWRLMQEEAAQRDETGDHARRSVLRKTYLYLVLFALVIGGMGFTGQLLYTLLNAILGQPLQNDFGYTIVQMALSLAIDIALLVYHWRALRQDSQMAQQTLGSAHQAFPTLILTENENDPFAQALISALERTAPRLPVAVNPISRGVPDETMLGAKAILIPVGMALKPSESLSLWLSEYRGQRILVPLEENGWNWLGQPEKSPELLAREAAQALRQMAEGEAVRQLVSSNPWAIVGYVLGGLFGLLLLSFIFSIMLSALFR